MGNFNRGGGFGGRDRGRDRDRGPKQMHHAVCDNCGKDCEVPFKPTGDKPVLCSDCFSKSRGDDDRGGNRRDSRDSRRGGFGDKTMYIATCDNCGNRCEVPFRPTPGKPVLCDNCFSKNKGSSGRGGGGADMTKQFEMLGAKLDKILEALGASEKKPAAAKEEKKEAAKKAPAKKDAAKKTATKKTSAKKAPAKKEAAKKKK